MREQGLAEKHGSGSTKVNYSMEQAAFQEVVDHLSQPLLHYLERYVGTLAVAQDLLQETLLRMHKGIASFAGRSSVNTWAFSIANHVAADYLRRPQQRVQIIAVDEVTEPVDPGRSIDEQMVVGEMNACIRRAIDSLPDSYRAALILHDLEGLSAEQTAEVCECSVATAKIRIHRARLRLKEALIVGCDFYRDEDSVFRCDRKV